MSTPDVVMLLVIVSVLTSSYATYVTGRGARAFLTGVAVGAALVALIAAVVSTRA